MGLSEDLRWGETPAECRRKSSTRHKGWSWVIFSVCKRRLHQAFCPPFWAVLPSNDSGLNPRCNPSTPAAVHPPPRTPGTPPGPWESAARQQPDTTPGRASPSLCQENARTSLQARPGITPFCAAFRHGGPGGAHARSNPVFSPSPSKG